MTRVLFFLFFLSTTAFSQGVDSDSLVNYIKIQGDSVIRSSIDLDKVILLPKKEFKNSDEIKKYLILKRKTLKVYSYAVLASNRLTKLNERLAPVKRRRDKKNYTKKVLISLNKSNEYSNIETGYMYHYESIPTYNSP